MTNKELQEELKYHPEELEVFIQIEGEKIMRMAGPVILYINHEDNTGYLSIKAAAYQGNIHD